MSGSLFNRHLCARNIQRKNTALGKCYLIEIPEAVHATGLIYFFLDL